MINIITNGIFQRDACVALGTFDGVHIGHAELLRACVLAAKKNALTPAVYTFLNHPSGVMGASVPLLTTPSQKTAEFEKLGIELCYLERFTPAFAALSPEQFVDELLVAKLRAKVCVCGFHYHFGRGGIGDEELLCDLCKARGIEVLVIPPVTLGGELVSSSELRRIIAAGDLLTAAKALGRPYSLCAPVVEGNKLGRTIGAPTINQRFDPEAVIPKRGVYETRIKVGEKVYKGVTNVGCRPTVSGDSLNAETYILDFSGDLYGRMIEISFIKWLRSEQKFATVSELKEQIAQDVKKVRPSSSPDL